MSDEQQQVANPDPPEVSLRGRRIRNPKLRRGIFLLPSLFTTGNLVCGYYACVATLLGTAQAGDPFDRAAKAIGLAMVFDSLDGRVARLTGTNTEFGVQFDSLADVVSFGIAPGLLAYSWGVRNLPGLESTRYGSGRLEIFRRDADAGCGGNDRGHRACLQRSDPGLALVRRMDFARAGFGISDDQYDPFLQLQGPAMDAQTAIARDRNDRIVRRGDLALV
jgi:hypothetical protein